MASMLYINYAYENKDKEDYLETFFDIFFKESKNVSECSICYEKKKSVKLKCNHEFCKTCLSEWSMRTINCPLCRENF